MKPTRATMAWADAPRSDESGREYDEGERMTPEEIADARRQVAMDLAIAEAEERRAEVIAADLTTALRKAEEAMARAAAVRLILEREGEPTD